MPRPRPRTLVQGCCGLVDPGMGDDEAERVAERFKALADPTRVRILNLLVRNPELCVCDMNASFDLSQPTISHHLSILKKAGLVDCDVARTLVLLPREQASDHPTGGDPGGRAMKEAVRDSVRDARRRAARRRRSRRRSASAIRLRSPRCSRARPCSTSAPGPDATSSRRRAGRSHRTMPSASTSRPR